MEKLHAVVENHGQKAGMHVSVFLTESEAYDKAVELACENTTYDDFEAGQLLRQHCHVKEDDYEVHLTNVTIPSNMVITSKPQ